MYLIKFPHLQSQTTPSYHTKFEENRSINAQDKESGNEISKSIKGHNSVLI